MRIFQIKQIEIFLWGTFLCLSIVIILLISSCFRSNYTYLRNTFGKGAKEISLQLDHDGEKEDITLTLEEKKLTTQEENEIFSSFFAEVKEQMRGDNPSLDKVNLPLDFSDSVKGYPFTVTYEPEDVSYINWNGEPGDAALTMNKGEKIKTSILIEASYKDYMQEESVEITLIPQQKEKLSLFETFQEYLGKEEEKLRNKDEFSVESVWKEVKVTDSSSQNLWKIPIFIIAIMVLLLFRGHSQLKEEEKMRHRENMEDFPLIVHLLTLYMGAGLSFASAVERISSDYEHSRGQTYKRYAFEQICVMNHCLHMGLRPKEVCLEWGSRFHEKMYAKFAMLLSQGFSKGAKEIRSMMEKEQQDAFQIQVDYVRKEGEEASTRLLFPMIVLLFVIMVLVMFPAIMQFKSM